jgi:hypothetical protein
MPYSGETLIRKMLNLSYSGETILNLPPWLLGLISGPQQPVNDIDTYFRPLVEDMNVLWYNNRV